MYPDWGLALAVTWAGLATSVISLVASIQGFRRKPPVIAFAVFDLGALAGVVGLVAATLIQLLAHGNWNLI
jgi:hypothetical protein